MPCGGANQRVYVSPVTDRVNVGKDEGLRFPGWTGGDGAIGKGRGKREEGRETSERDRKKILRPPHVRPCVTVCVARIFMRYITYSGK